MTPQEWDAKYAAKPDLWKRGPNALLAGLLAGSPPGRAVDLACGDGRHAAWLASRGWSVTAVDFSPGALGQAGNRDTAVEWVEADARSWRPERADLDLVLVAYLHLPQEELRAVLATAASWLAPTGRLVYLGHAAENFEHGVGGPPEPEVLPGIVDLAPAASGLYVYSLRHVFREADEGTAIDILLDAGRATATPGTAGPE